MRTLTAFASLACVVLLAGCTPTSQTSAPTASGSASGSPSSAASTSASAAASAGASAAAEPTAAVTDYKVTFDFGVGAAVVTHSGAVPELRRLVGIYVGDHPTDTPAFQRMSFYFRGGYPSYQVGYASSVVNDGSGFPVSLPGNVFVKVLFTGCQAHTDAGGPSIVAAPPATIGYANLKGYAPAGDYEGYVTYGLGVQSPSGQKLPIRVGELTKSDGAGGTLYVIFVDVKST